MSTGPPAIVKDLASPDGWDFRGIPYGLEPLVIPMPTAGDEKLTPETPSPESPHFSENASRRLLLMTEMHDALIEKGLGSVEPGNGLFWFRWITGHQVSFIIWQLIAGSIAKVNQGRAPQNNALQAITRYVRGYCGMLLYTSSCPREIYEKLIRPSMFVRHRAFSASWALDFRPVRDLFRGRMPAWAENPDAGELRHAVKLCHLIHSGVAAKLVPNGRSLLQQSGFVTQDTDEDRLRLGAIYDSYFMTRRAPVPFHEVFAQLLRRLCAITQDVAANGFHPLGTTSYEEEPHELRSAEVVAFDREFFETSFRIASLAAGFTDGHVSEQNGMSWWSRPALGGRHGSI